MKLNKKFCLLTILLTGFINLTFAQTETEITKSDKKVVIVTKTKDADGNEVVEKVVKEGEEIDDAALEKMINAELEAKGVKLKKGEQIEKEVEEEVIIDENGKKTTTRRIKMKVGDEKVQQQDREVIIKEGEQLAMKKMQKQKKIQLEIVGETDEVIDLGDGTEIVIKQKADSKKKIITITVEEEQ